jgi:hypothetical protein
MKWQEPPKIRSEKDYWRGKIQRILKHELQGRTISFNDLLLELGQYNTKRTQITSALLWYVINLDSSRFEVVAHVRALASKTWRPPARPEPDEPPPPDSQHEPRTPAEADEEE